MAQLVLARPSFERLAMVGLAPTRCHCSPTAWLASVRGTGSAPCRCSTCYRPPTVTGDGCAAGGWPGLAPRSDSSRRHVVRLLRAGMQREEALGTVDGRRADPTGGSGSRRLSGRDWIGALAERARN